MDKLTLASGMITSVTMALLLYFFQLPWWIVIILASSLSSIITFKRLTFTYEKRAVLIGLDIGMIGFIIYMIFAWLLGNPITTDLYVGVGFVTGGFLSARHHSHNKK